MIIDYFKLNRQYFYDETVVLAHGCFDPLHIGHIRYLRAAKELIDARFYKPQVALVVTITPDRFVNKGPGRPAFPEAIRAEVVDALRWVDAVAINEYPTAVETIHLLRPAVYVKGGEYRDKLTPALEAEKAAVESVGGRLVFTETEKFSSTELLARLSTEPYVPDEIRCPACGWSAADVPM